MFMSAKEVLDHQIRLAFCEDDEMSVMAAIEGHGDEIMDKRISDDTWSVGEILYHAAFAKIKYCKEGWGKWSNEIEPPLDDLEAMKALLIKANDHLLECLRTLDEDDLDKPLSLSYHGKSAYHFFSVMVIHDTAHAAQIRATLRHCGIRKGGFYPVA